MNLKDLAAAFAGLSEADRPIRLRLSYKRRVLDDVLLVKHVTGHESLCGGLEYRLLCISTRSDLPLKEFIARGRKNCNRLCRIAGGEVPYQNPRHLLPSQHLCLLWGG
jgi:hypothetical protein